MNARPLFTTLIDQNKWHVEQRVSQPVRAVNLHHVLGNDHPEVARTNSSNFLSVLQANHAENTRATQMHPERTAIARVRDRQEMRFAI